MKMMIRMPDRAAPLMVYTRAVMRGPSAFSPVERELMFAFGSHLNACRYCYGSHTVVVEALGIDPAVFAEIAQDIATSCIDKKMRPVLRLVEKLTLTPARVVQADSVVAAGWDEAATRSRFSLQASSWAFSGKRPSSQVLQRTTVANHAVEPHPLAILRPTSTCTGQSSSRPP